MNEWNLTKRATEDDQRAVTVHPEVRRLFPQSSFKEIKPFIISLYIKYYPHFNIYNYQNILFCLFIFHYLFLINLTNQEFFTFRKYKTL